MLANLCISIEIKDEGEYTVPTMTIHKRAQSAF